MLFFLKKAKIKSIIFDTYARQLAASSLGKINLTRMVNETLEINHDLYDKKILKGQYEIQAIAMHVLAYIINFIVTNDPNWRNWDKHNLNMLDSYHATYCQINADFYNFDIALQFDDYERQFYDEISELIKVGDELGERRLARIQEGSYP